MPLALFALAVCAFAIGCTEFVVIGILPILAPEFQISLAKAGQLVTWYAGAVIVGAPLIPAVTTSIPRKTLVVILMGTFTIGNLLAAVATNWEMLVIGRILTGCMHGAFFALSTNIAIQLVSKEKKGRAIALMFSGLTVALVAGVPLGTFLASHFSWSTTFFVVAAFGFMAFLSILFFLHSNIPYDKPKKMFKQFNILLCNKMLMAYCITVLSFGGPFIAYTYIVAILQKVSGFSESWIGPLLVLHGIAVAIGNLWGGKISDSKGPLHALNYFVPCMIVILLFFYWGQHNKIMSVILMVAWGVAAFAVVPALQYFVMSLANKLKLQVTDVVAGLNISAFNLGIAGGSLAGSFTVKYWGLVHTPLLAALATVIALILIKIASKRLKTVA